MSWKKYGSLGIALGMLACGTSLAGGVNKDRIYFETRWDWLSSTTERGSQRTAKTSAFRASRLRVNFRGKMYDSWSYRVRFDLRKFHGGRGTNNSSTIPDALNYAYLTKKVNSNFSFTLGKQFLPVGGWENDYSGSKQYQYSTGNDSLPGYNTAIKGTLTGKPGTLHLVLSNAERSNSGGSTDANEYALGLDYGGSFLDGKFQPKLNYYVFNTGRASSKDKFLTLAVKTEWDMFFFHVDWIRNAFEDLTTVNKDDVDTTLNLQLRLKLGKFQPFVKWWTTKWEPAEVESRTDSGWTVALEYYPLEDQKYYNYHLVYTSREKDYKSAATTDEDRSQIYLGMTAFWDMM